MSETTYEEIVGRDLLTDISWLVKGFLVGFLQSSLITLSFFLFTFCKNKYLLKMH